MTDPDTPIASLVWTASTPVNYTVGILNSTATITAIDPEWNGDEDITFTATDPEGGFGSEIAGFEVTAVSDEPVLVGIPDQTVAEGDTFADIDLSLYVTDPDTDLDDLGWTASTPVNFIVDIVGSVATIVPIDPEWNGAEDITFTAIDGTGPAPSSSDTAAFEVTAVNDPPVVADIPDQTVAEGDPFVTIVLDDFVSDLESLDSEIIWAATGQIDLVIDIVDRVVTITASVGWNGSEPITFTATDENGAGLSASDAATFTVTSVITNTAPVIADLGTVPTNPNFPELVLDLEPFVTDEEPASALSWSVTDNDDFNVLFIEGVAHVRIKKNGWFGTDTMTLTATDSGGLSGQAQLTVTMDSLFEMVVEIVVDGTESFYAGTRSVGTEGFDHGYDQLISSVEPSLRFAQPEDMNDFAFIRHMMAGSETDVARTLLDGVVYQQYYSEYRGVPMGDFCIYECIWNYDTDQFDCRDDCQFEPEPGRFYSLIWTPGGDWADIDLVEETDQVWLRTDTHPLYDATTQVENWNFQVGTSNNGPAPITRTLQFNPSFAEGESIDLNLYDSTLGVLVDLWPDGTYSYEIPVDSAEVRSFTLFIGTPGTTGDTDGDGVPDNVDECPGEDASFFDRDGDGCIDPVISGRHIEYWAEGSFPLAYSIYQAGAPGISDDSDVTAIQDGFTAWTEVIGSEITVDYLGLTDNPTANAFDGNNTVTFSDGEYAFPSGVIAVGLSTSYSEADHANGIRPGQIIDTDMIFNPQMTYRTDTAGPNDGTYIRGVVTHEAGHMLGLSHSGVRSSTMFYVLPSGTEAATLEAEDRQAMYKAYYSQASYVGTSHLKGTVTDGLTGQPISGAIVFVITAATNDTVASDFTLPADGSYHFIGLLDGSYNLAIHPLNGSSAIGYLEPKYINPLILGTADILFEPEFWDAAESNSDDSAVSSPVVVSAGATTEANFITNIDTTGPTVTQVSPASGAEAVPTDSAILFRCDEAIDPGSLVGNFNFQVAAGGDFLLGNASVVQDGTVLAYVPTVNLEFNTEYLLEVGAGLKDLYGNTMGASYATTFTTEIRPDGVSMANLIPRKGVAGSILVINGEGFSGIPTENIVTYGGVTWDVEEATPSQLVVRVRDDALPSTALIQVQAFGSESNEQLYTVLAPGEEAHGLETAIVDLFALPRKVEVAPDGDFVYIATEQGLSYVDVNDATSPIFSSLPLGNGLNDLDVTPEGDRVYAISGIDRIMYSIDTDPVITLDNTALDFRPLGILVDPSGQQAYLATDYNEIQIWDINENSIHFLNQIGTLTTPAPNLLGAMATDPAGSFLLALDGAGQLLVYDLASFELEAEIPLLGSARDVVVDPLGERAYVTDDTGYLSLVSLGSFSKFIDLPTGGALQGAAIDPMGSFLYAVNHQLNNLDVIDLRIDSPTYRTISTRLPQQVNPVDVALSPDGLYAYVIVESEQRLVINTVGAGPMMSSLSRRSGPEGARVVLAGLDFTGGTVSFGSIPAVIERAEDTSLTVTVPAGAASGPVMVLGDEPGEVSNAINFEVLDSSPAGGLRLASSVQPEGLPALTGALAAASNDRILAIGGQDGRVHLLDIDPASMDFNQFIGETDALAGPIEDLVIAPDGLSLFAVTSSASAVAMFNINPGSVSFGELLTSVDLVTAAPEHLAVSPDGRYVLAADAPGQQVHILNWADAASLTASLGSVPGPMAFHPGGLYAYVAEGSGVTVINLIPGDPGFGSTSGPVDVGDPVVDLDISPDGDLCFAMTSQGNRTLVTLDTSNPAAPINVDSLTLPSTAAAMDERLVLSPAGDRALLNIRDDGLFLVDLLTGEYLTQPNILADGSPLNFGFSTDGARVFAATSADGMVSTFDFNSQQEMELVWGDEQVGEANQPLNSTLRVRVTDPLSGEGLSGVPVTFSIDSGGVILGQAGTGKPDQLPILGLEKDSSHVRKNLGTPDGNKSGGETIDDAEVITGLPFLDTGNTSDNTDEYDELCPFGPSNAPDVVYSWTADFNGAITIDLCGSGYDTKVYVYADALDPGNPWGCNDDAYLASDDPCGQFVSRIDDLVVYEGTTYFIIVDGYGLEEFNGDAGDYSLSVTKSVDTVPWGFFVIDDPEATPTTLVVGTDALGFADVTWSLGPTPDPQGVTASSLGVTGSPLQFTATGVTDPESIPFSLVESRLAPASGAVGVSVTTAIQITFTRPFIPGTVTAATFFLSDDGGTTPIPSIIGQASDNTTASLTSLAVLDYGTEYTVVAASEIYAPPFLPLTNPQTFTFTTEVAPLAPTLTGINPPSSIELVPVMVSGSGFSPDLSQNEVFFGGVSAPIISAEPDFILTRVPLGVGSGIVQIQVTVDGQPTNALPFTVLEPSLDGADEVVVRIPTGSATRSATISPDGAIIYAVAPMANLVIPIDLINFTTMASIPVGNEPWAISSHPDGGLVYVANRQSGDASVIDIDPGSSTYNQTISSVQVGTHPVDILVTPAGDRVLVANEGSQDLAVIDGDPESASFNYVINRVPAGSAVKTVTVTPDGARIYLGTDEGYILIGAVDYGVVRRVPTGSAVKSVTVSPDGALLVLVDTAGLVTIYDIAEGSPTEDQVVARVPVSSGVKTATVSPDGARLYAVMEEGDIINVYALDIGTSVGAIDALNPRPVLELVLLDTLTAGENPQVVVFDPSGSGRFIVPNAGDNTISVFDVASDGVLTGMVYADCPEPETPLAGVEVDIYSNNTGTLLTTVLTDESGAFEIALPSGQYMATLMTPLGFAIEVDELQASISSGQTTACSWALECEDIIPNQRRMGWWKRQFAVALGGWGRAQIDGPTLCGYLDNIAGHFNSNSINQVVIYQPPASDECQDKLLAAKELLNFWGNWGPEARAKQQLLALLLNVASSRLSLQQVISADGVNVSQAITYCDNLIDDGNPDNDWTAWRVAFRINVGWMVPADVIPISLPNIFYSPVATHFHLDQNYPNPFNPECRIRFGVPRPGHVRLKIFDIGGRLVKTLVDEQLIVGTYIQVWDGFDNRGLPAASGVYFYKIEAGSFIQTRKMLLMK